jgi:YHS domain-containing protein
MKFKYFVYVAIIALVGICAVACAKTEGVAKINTTSEGLAVRGYDAVAYFTVQNALKGNPQFEYAWNGAKWLFSSAENLEKFKADPAAYAPQFGGYCAYAVSHGHTADGDPLAWKVVDGRLYLNYSPEVKQMWEKEQGKFINDGETNWSQFLIKKPEDKK